MNVNAAIIDQRLSSIVNDIRGRAKDELNIADEVKLKSLGFIYLSVRTILDLSDEEAFDCLTDGPRGAAVLHHCSHQSDWRLPAAKQVCSTGGSPPNHSAATVFNLGSRARRL